MTARETAAAPPRRALLPRALDAYARDHRAMLAISAGAALAAWPLREVGEAFATPISGTDPKIDIFRHEWRSLAVALVMVAAATAGWVVVQRTEGRAASPSDILREAMRLVLPTMAVSLLGMLLVFFASLITAIALNELNKAGLALDTFRAVIRAASIVPTADVYGGVLLPGVDWTTAVDLVALSPLFVALTLGPLVLALEGGGKRAAVRRSRALVRPLRWRLLGATYLVFVVGLSPYLLALQLDVPWSDAPARLALSLLAALPLPLWGCVLAIAYRESSAAMPVPGVRRAVGVEALTPPRAIAVTASGRPLTADAWFQLFVLLGIVSAALTIYDRLPDR